MTFCPKATFRDSLIKSSRNVSHPYSYSMYVCWIPETRIRPQYHSRAQQARIDTLDPDCPLDQEYAKLLRVHAKQDADFAKQGTERSDTIELCTECFPMACTPCTRTTSHYTASLTFRTCPPIPRSSCKTLGKNYKTTSFLRIDPFNWIPCPSLLSPHSEPHSQKQMYHLPSYSRAHNG
jgi:hypothetical protein